MRTVSVAVFVALALYWIGSVFGLNGDQWMWWRTAAFAAAVLCLILAVFRSRVAAFVNRKPRVVLAGGFGGLLLLGGSLASMATRYSDPYAGPLLWPHILALVGLLGFALLGLSAIALSQRQERRPC